MPQDRHLLLHPLLHQRWQRASRILSVWWREERRDLHRHRLRRPLLAGTGVALALALLAAAEMRWANFERVRVAQQRESLAILNASLTALERITLDWAHWTDLYEWVEGSNPRFVSTDLQPSPLFRDGGLLLWFDPESGGGQSFSAQGVDHPSHRSLVLCARSAVVRKPSLNATLALVCRADDGLLHLGIATGITDSSEKAPIRGTLVMFEPLLKPQAGPLYNLPLTRLVAELRLLPSSRAQSGPPPLLAAGPAPAAGERLEPLGLRWPLLTAGGANLMLCRDPWWPVLLRGFLWDLLLLASLVASIALVRALLLAERRHLRLLQRGKEQISNRRIRRTGHELDRLLERIGRVNPQRSRDEQVLARLIHSPVRLLPSSDQLRTAPVEAKLERLADQLEYFLQRAKSLALLDPLTQLPNRRYFIEQVQLQVEDAAQQGQHLYAILFVDVDKFKNINDSYGHAVGDAALVLVANRLRTLIGANDFLGRYGGDEFAILLQLPAEASGGLPQGHFPDPPSGQAWIQRRLYEEASGIVNHFGSQVHLDDLQFDLTISVGIALVDPHGHDSAAAMRRADIAMHRAKQNTTARVAVFDSSDEDGYLDSYGLYVDLMQAIRDSRFEIVFQPIVDRRAHILGVEALSRWHHPRLGEVRPDVFLDLAESYRQINPLSNDLIALALASFAPLQRQYPPLRLSLNVPPSKLCDPLFPRELDHLLASHGLRPAQLTIEVTERSPLLVDSHLAANLRALKERGMTISLDDFGTGYSSLSLLTLLQPDEVKIDRSFVEAMQRDSLACQIVGLMADMVQRMDLQVVAEGVEDAGVWEQLLHLRIPCFQGFYFSQPLSAQELGRSTLWRNSISLSTASPRFGEDGKDPMLPGLP
jgi:predicted signal transduction protein with EAL and GGDEF domain